MATTVSEDEQHPDLVTHMARVILAAVQVDPVLIGRKAAAPCAAKAIETASAGIPPADPAALAAA